MKKKGFTLIELLAVIAILAIVITIALISVTRIRENALLEVVDTKKDQIEQAAILYGQENPNELTSDTSNGCTNTTFTTRNEEREVEYTINFCVVKTAGDLIDGGYFDSGYLDEVEGKQDLINDVTGKSMRGEEVIIYRRNNRIYSILKEKV